MAGWLSDWSKGLNPNAPIIPGMAGSQNYLGNLSNWGTMSMDNGMGGIPIPAAPVGLESLTRGGVGGVASSITTPGLGKLGLNMPTAQLGLTGLATIGSLWGAFKQASLAKKQFALTKDVTETNLANQLKTYNTGITDRANSRAVVEGRSPEETAAYINANSLSRYGRG